MKNYNFRAILMALILALCCAVTASAHPGKTDASGGHWNLKESEYHYHHGYPAHQHPDGECPYNYEQKPAEQRSLASGTHPIKKISTTTWLLIFVLFLSILIVWFRLIS